MEPITLDQLRVLQTVVDEGGFSAAARRLHRAQSAVSYAIANLERLLGVALFDRNGRRPELTEAGRALLSDVRTVSLNVEQLQARARSIAGGVEPRVSIVVDAMFPMPALLSAVGEFRDAWPQVALVVSSESLGAVAQQVIDGACKLGVAGPLPRWPSELVRAPLGAIELVHVVAPTHPLAAHRGLVPASALREHVQLVLSDRSRLTDGIDLGVVSPRVWRLADLSTRLEFVRAGFGWCSMPSDRVAEDLRTGRLVRIRLADPADPGTLRVAMYAVHRADEMPGPAGAWLLDRLATAMNGCAKFRDAELAKAAAAREPERVRPARAARTASRRAR